MFYGVKDPEMLQNVFRYHYSRIYRYPPPTARDQGMDSTRYNNIHEEEDKKGGESELDQHMTTNGSMSR